MAPSVTDEALRDALNVARAIIVSAMEGDTGDLDEYAVELANRFVLLHTMMKQGQKLPQLWQNAGH